MLKNIRESLALVLITLLPFHAFLVTAFTKVIAGPNHAPLAWLALWKEAVLGIILLSVVLEILQSKQWKDSDWIDMCIFFLLGLSVLVTLLTHRDAGLFAMGFKYDFVPLVSFILLRRVPWSGEFWSRALKCLLCSGVVMCVYGLITYALPDTFFRMVGYSDLHSLYIPDGPIAAFQQIGGGGMRRMQAAMSGPNQLGIWLLIPWSIALSCVVRHGSSAKTKEMVINVLTLLLFTASLVLTFSRSVWIAAVVLVFIVLVQKTYARFSKKVVSEAVIGVLVIAVAGVIAFPSVFIRASSSSDHLANSLKAVTTMVTQPFGMGLGTAGPASSKRADACVFLQVGDDPSWTAAHPNLCVFIDNKQIQPTGRACTCPFLTENWYLQIGVELGFIGLIIYVLMMYLVANALQKSEQRAVFLSFVGVSIVGVFLHSFEDSAVAYTVWMLVAVVLSFGDVLGIQKTKAKRVNVLQNKG